MEFLPVLQNNFDELKPSLFAPTRRPPPPSLRYLLALATHRHPRYLIRILNSFDEVYALLSLLVERHFLLTYGGGFTENFYGLKRERVLRVKGAKFRAHSLAPPMTNLAIMVGVPYLKRKLDEGYDIHAAHASVLGFQRREELRPGASVKERLLFYYKWFLRRVYPSVNAAYYFSLLAFNLAYLFDGSKFHSPWLWLVGTRMRRMGRADYKAIEAAAAPKVATARAGARPGQGGSVFNPRVMAGVVYPRLLSSLRILLPTSIFALKFLEWWHASDFARQLSRKAAEALELPPPVVSGLPAPSKSKATVTKDSAGSKIDSEKTTKSSSLPPNPPISSLTNLPILTVPYPVPSDSSPPDTSLCPICTSPIVTPTAAPSGYVYCYTCIHKWVDGTHERQTAFMEGGGGEEGWDDEGSREGGGRAGRTGMR
ncbi:ubiquitin-protein ligase peroxin 12 [Coniosporium tulheliwenetii]|uniref:Ubiquitin-protein ligase peroxin 12 n=1 Tax=Coniosporium tulheliwenetii TaxID=3383036 RepID=A0ACC2ZC07_9PEZI|nr:ubiquitin-protein ligase peroxin 12 [Cladosporium sp. JES 115]